jgi:uncharacterized repeat protein (TIGR02543 family)
MKHLKTGFFLALLVCAGIFIMSCEDPNKPNTGNEDTEVTVTFNADGGSPTPASVTVKKDTSMGDKFPTGNPGKTGYIFDGWFNGGIKYDRDTKVSRDITLTAEWTDASSATAVTFTGLTANGSASAATTKLTLTFSADITGLTATDITLTVGSTGAIKGNLTKASGTGVYELAVSGITAEGKVTVSSVTKSGYNITGTPKEVTVYRAPSSGPGPVAVAFQTVTANGSVTTTTTTLTLKFDKDIANLSADDITLTGTTGATKGALTRTATGTYNLAITGVTASGSVTVAVEKGGFTISGSSKQVSIFYRNSSAGVKVTTWKNLTAPAATNATQHTTYQGKNDVLHIAPSNAEYEWNVLQYSLNDYANKEITITVSMEVYLPTSTKVAWQVNQTGYPVIAGSTQTSLTAGQWHTVIGTATITVDGTGKFFYLSKEQLGAANEIYIANFSINVDEITGSGGGGGGTSGTGGAKWEGNTVTMTIGARENLAGKITFDPAGRNLTWASDTTAVATVNSFGVVTAVGFTSGGNVTASSSATGTAKITVTAGSDSQEFIVNTTMVSQIDLNDLTPLKELFAGKFMMGNISRGSADHSSTAITNTRLTRHFNVLTAENDMKPSYFGGTRNGSTVSGFTWASPDNFVNAAYNSGFKVHGHVLLWHNQNSQWIKNLDENTGEEVALAAMRDYIYKVMDRYRGKVYSWDVLNEVIPDGVSATANWKTSIRTVAITNQGQDKNPWWYATKEKYVYEGFKAARLADPNVILYYNDYNMDDAAKSTVVANMISEVNEQWKNDRDNTDKNRLLIEGIGMQSHHNTTITATKIEQSLIKFKALGLKISISELDVLCMDYNSYNNSTGGGTGKASQSIATNTQKLAAANLYRDYFILFLKYPEIERVTFWGLFDNASWRSGGLPLPFEGDTNNTSPSKILAKPAYYKILEALGN